MDAMIEMFRGVLQQVMEYDLDTELGCKISQRALETSVKNIFKLTLDKSSLKISSVVQSARTRSWCWRKRMNRRGLSRWSALMRFRPR